MSQKSMFQTDTDIKKEVKSESNLEMQKKLYPNHSSIKEYETLNNLNKQYNSHVPARQSILKPINHYSFMENDNTSNKLTPYNSDIMDQCTDTITTQDLLLTDQKFTAMCVNPNTKQKSNNNKNNTKKPSRLCSFFGFSCCNPSTEIEIENDSNQNQNQNQSTQINKSQSSSSQKSKSKQKTQKLKDADWFKDFKAMCDEELKREEPFYFYRQIFYELKSKFKISQSQSDIRFLHDYSLNQIEESIKLHEQHQKEYEQEQKLIDSSIPIIQHYNQQKQIDKLMNETYLLNEANITVDFSKSSFVDNNPYSQLKKNKSGLKSFLRTGSTTSNTSMSFMVRAADDRSASIRRPLMNNATLILDGNSMNENQKMFSSVFFYKQVVKLIEKQIRNINHPLGFIRHYYQEQFFKKFGKKQQISLEDTMNEFSIFTEIYTELIRIYYDIDTLTDNYPVQDTEQYLNDENLYNFVQCILFSREQIYSTLIYKLAKEDDQNNIRDKYIENLKKLYEKPIEFFEVPPQFQLNQTTVQHHLENKNLEIDLSDLNKSELVSAWNLDQDLSPNNKTDSQNSSQYSKNSKNSQKSQKQQKKKASQLSQISLSQLSSKSSSSSNLGMRYGLNTLPYEKVIQYFRKMDQVRAPLHKLKVLIKTTELIDEAIKDFYQANYIRLGRKCHFDADQFISIFLYIIAQAQMESLFEHCKLIENFTNQNTLNSASGYLMVTLQCCVHHIAGMNVDQARSTSVNSQSVNSFFSLQNKEIMNQNNQNNNNNYNNNSQLYHQRETPYFV